MPPQDTGKTRAARIPLDYYKQRNSLERWQNYCGVAALLASIAFFVPNVLTSNQFDFYASRGPVAAVHQSWDNQCSVCHASFTPISTNSWTPFFLGHAKNNSEKCRDCHAGPDHFKDQADDRTCGSCHRDHQGKDASLVNLADSDCTQCHKNLDSEDLKKYRHKEKKFATIVTGFDKVHPEFRSIEKDPGKLKFSHHVHMTPGLTVNQRLDDIPKEFRQRYKEKDGVVALDCASCHQLDTVDFGLPGQRNAGAYMVPITYDNQCQACHPLTMAYKQTDQYLRIPHRMPIPEIHSLLENYFTARVARGLGDFLKQPLRPLPGKDVNRALKPDDEKSIQKQVSEGESNLYTVEKHVRKMTGDAERNLYASKQSCAECHYFEQNKRVKTPEELKEHVQMGLLDFQILPTKVPTAWFEHAKFSHVSHRAVDCMSCHVNAKTSDKHTDVLIPDRKLCVQCHAPKTATGSPGARFNCTECHQYHHGDKAMHGVGVSNRNPKERQMIDKLLRGK